MDLDPTRPIVPVHDEESANQSFFNANGTPRERAREVMLVIANIAHDDVPAIPFVVHAHGSSETAKQLKNELDEAIDGLRASGQRTLGVGVDASSAGEAYLWGKCALTVGNEKLPPYYLGLGFSGGVGFFFGELVQSPVRFVPSEIHPDSTRMTFLILAYIMRIP